MDIKNVARSKRGWRTLKRKTSAVPNVEVITENVFVPITKTIFTKKRDALPYNIPGRKIELVKSDQCSNSPVMSLLRKPFCLPEESYTSLESYSKKMNKPSKRQGVRMSKQSPRLINESYIVLNDQSGNSSGRSRSRKKQVLLFPSSISDLPMTSFDKCQPPSINKKLIKSDKWKENDKMIGKAAISDTRRTLPNLSKKSGNDRKLKSNRAECIVRGLQNDFKQSDSNISSSSIVSSSTTNIPLSATTTARITSVQKDAVEKQPSFIPYCDSALRDVNRSVKSTVSSSMISHKEELQFPVTCIESNIFSRVQCTTLDLSMPDNLLDANRTDTLDDMYSKILTTRNFRRALDNVDHSILSFFKTNQSQYQDSCCKKEHCYPCGIKYSWQVIGTSSQTSRTLLESLIKEKSIHDDESRFDCSVKYSWQIIGIATQTSRRDLAAMGCHSAISFLSAKPNTTPRRDVKETANEAPIATVWRKGKRYIVLHNQSTQTFAHKDSQTVFMEFYKDYHDCTSKASNERYKELETK
ncbi:uncharacterized protein LOC143426959 [Xylocopa sonorina]|uniref:uncharacterized protein LOC143426959 n=1 Tax=Xylocopa sonorina TaxID=1818115 RepID=UPI00403B009F